MMTRMTDDGRIVVDGLTKHFGKVRAVNDLSFTVEPGTVTGFLGPNGAGKTTTLRCLLGLVSPTKGTATIGGAGAAHPPPPPPPPGAWAVRPGLPPPPSPPHHPPAACAAAAHPQHPAPAGAGAG